MNNDLYKIDDIANMSKDEIFGNYKNYVNPGLASLISLMSMDRDYVKAKGIFVWDKDGHRYMDFLGGYGSLNLGHNPPEVIEEMEKIKEMPNILKTSLSKLSGALAHNLAKITPGTLKNTFFCNSGAEAVEGALKTARISTGKTGLISCEGSFHGKTLGALSVTGRTKYQEPFKPLIPECSLVPFGDLDLLEKELAKGDIAAFIVEPIQGEGGVIVPPNGYLKGARELCTKYGALLIVDEIQTGLGRTGYMFACEHEEVEPDIMCLAKSLGGGVMPIGAFITTPEVWNKAYGSTDKCLLHTSTFGENTWALAAGISAINAILELNLSKKSRDMGDYFIDKLNDLKEKYKIIKEVRGEGLLIGIEFEQPAKGILDKISQGALNKFASEYTGAMIAGELLNTYRIITAYTLNNPNVIRLEPPLIVNKEQIDYVISSLDEIFRKHKGFLGITLKSARTALGSIFGR
ncbi:MAG TPA: aspartate aminotransferase family protein [Thermoanaerobacterales bacterium]|nr:aspartate aminotransferase family protein [Thermoanaerobacterales bacterium]